VGIFGNDEYEECAEENVAGLDFVGVVVDACPDGLAQGRSTMSAEMNQGHAPV